MKRVYLKTAAALMAMLLAADAPVGVWNGEPYSSLTAVTADTQSVREPADRMGSGAGEGLFNPEEAISRQGAAALIKLDAESSGWVLCQRADREYADREDAAPWGREAV